LRALAQFPELERESQHDQFDLLGRVLNTAAQLRDTFQDALAIVVAWTALMCCNIAFPSP
jgi:hypothetical protein